MSNVEKFFDSGEFIASKTDLKGKITYVNDVFISISGYNETELLGRPHNMIRHPDMPRAVFNLLWSRLLDGKDIFAYVKNMCKNGDYYWVFAHAGPSYNEADEVVGYHSTRRIPDADTVKNAITPLYKQLCDIENAETSPKVGMQKSTEFLTQIIIEKGMDYDEFILSL